MMSTSTSTGTSTAGLAAGGSQPTNGMETPVTQGQISGMFEEFMCRIKDTLEETNPPTLKRPLAEPQIDFKYKGNKRQYDVNTRVLSYIEHAETLINKGKINQALESLDEAKEGIKHRNKLIRLADTSEAGWDMVDEYETKALASDSDDDRKIRRAETTALKKRNLKLKQKRPFSTFVPGMAGPIGGWSNTNNSGIIPPVQPWQQRQPLPLPPPQQQQQQLFRSQPFPARRQGGPGPFDLCFACGQQGHWRSTCPATTVHSQQLQPTTGFAQKKAEEHK